MMALATDWRVLRDAELRAAMEGRRVTYTSGAWQEFRASGRTLYNAGQDSWGYWRIEGERYCSSWPPSDLWACYDVQLTDDRIRFVGAGGDITDGVFGN